MIAVGVIAKDVIAEGVIAKDVIAEGVIAKDVIAKGGIAEGVITMGVRDDGVIAIAVELIYSTCRYTPKPYFTAPTTTASSSQTKTSVTRAPQPLRPRTNLSSDAWQGHKQRSSVKSLSYAKAATNSTSSKSAVKPVSIEVDDGGATSSPAISEKDQATIRTMFVEMFKGRVEHSVIDMVLQSVNWNGKFLV